MWWDDEKITTVYKQSNQTEAFLKEYLNTVQKHITLPLYELTMLFVWNSSWMIRKLQESVIGLKTKVHYCWRIIWFLLGPFSAIENRRAIMGPIEGLKRVKNIKVADYPVANQLVEDPAFKWWVLYTLRKRDFIISKVTTRVKKKTHKFMEYGFLELQKKHMRLIN